MDAARVRLQVDVGFGDAVVPKPELVDFPTLFDFRAPRLRAYRRETVIAEKLEAMVSLGLANSRMKDFYDLATLSKFFDFEGNALVEAIRATFERRKTLLPAGLPIGLTAAFTDDASKKSQWRAFLRKSNARTVDDLPVVAGEIARFVERPLEAAATTAPFDSQWRNGGPWS